MYKHFSRTRNTFILRFCPVHAGEAVRRTDCAVTRHPTEARHEGRGRPTVSDEDAGSAGGEAEEQLA